MICALKPGGTLDGITLEAFLRERMASYKVPRQFYFWDSLPKTGYGKLSKLLLRTELTRRLAEAEVEATQ